MTVRKASASIQGDVAVPGHMQPDLVVIERGLVLGGLETLLHGPSGARHADQLGHPHRRPRSPPRGRHAASSIHRSPGPAHTGRAPKAVAALASVEQIDAAALQEGLDETFAQVSDRARSRQRPSASAVRPPRRVLPSTAIPASPAGPGGRAWVCGTPSSRDNRRPKVVTASRVAAGGSWMRVMSMTAHPAMYLARAAGDVALPSTTSAQATSSEPSRWRRPCRVRGPGRLTRNAGGWPAPPQAR